MVTAPERRKVVRARVTRGLSERHALTVVRMSASSFRYVPAPDQNGRCAIASWRSHTATGGTGPA